MKMLRSTKVWHESSISSGMHEDTKDWKTFSIPHSCPCSKGEIPSPAGTSESLLPSILFHILCPLIYILPNLYLLLRQWFLSILTQDPFLRMAIYLGPPGNDVNGQR